MYWLQRQVVHDFFTHLTEEQFDYRIVDMPHRKSDTPRESLDHILQVQLIYFNGVKTGRLEFKSMGVEHYWEMSKEQLLSEMERIDEEMLTYLTADTFDSSGSVETPWGDLGAIDALFFLRDHTILHIGWNLALMDHLGVPRFASLSEYWGPGDEESF
jgi:uncharacterized damage-inducible protein DinB